MQVFVVGTSHSVASAAVRERLHVEVDEVYAAVDELLPQHEVLDEAIVLTTCARLELYGVARDPARATKLLQRMLARRVGAPMDEVRKRFYVLRGPPATRHLFRVASGLDSVVHGEAQILGQVREAARHPLSKRSKGKVLHRLFEMSVATGKKVRSETDIGRGAASLASAALGMVQREMGPLGSRSALVLGAGETGSLVARLLAKAGVGRLVIANRTVETAQCLAYQLDAEAIALDQLAASIGDADLIVGAATAGEFLITPASFVRATRDPARTRHLVDLGHPRNFDPALADLPFVKLFDLDHVFERAEAAMTARAAQVPRAEAIVEEQARAFTQWLRSRESVEVLRAVRKQVLELARVEAERFGQGRSEEEKEQMRRLARSFARTLLHPPTVALRQADTSTEEGRFLLANAPALFGVHVDLTADPDSV